MAYIELIAILINMGLFSYRNKQQKVSSAGAMASVLDCDIVVSELRLHSRYYVHFRTNIPEKGMNFLIPPAMV